MKITPEHLEKMANCVPFIQPGQGENETADALRLFADFLCEAKASGFLTEDGALRKVLGKFQYTNDGAIACEEGEAYCVANPYGDGVKVFKCCRSGNPTDYGCWWQIDDCDSESVIVLSVWSTREAAEAARGPHADA
jgi:hypothetical protein